MQLADIFNIFKMVTEPILPIQGSWVDATSFLIVFIGLSAAALSLFYLKGKKMMLARTIIRSIFFILMLMFLYKCICIFRNAVFGLNGLAWNDLLSFSNLFLFFLVGAFTLVFGNLFCGWLCPIGFINEVSMKIRFFRKPYIRPTYLFFVLFLFTWLIYRAWPGNEFPVEFFVVLIGYVLNILLIIDHFFPSWRKVLIYFKYMIAFLYLFACFMGVYFSNAWCPIYGMEYDYSALIILFILLFLGFGEDMPWCRFACPTGFLLRLISKYSFFRLRLDKDKKNGNICPMHAINNGKIEQIKCMCCGKCRAFINAEIVADVKNSD